MRQSSMPPVRHYTRHHDARSAPRRLEPGGIAPTRREPGVSRAQTALTDTPAIYTTAPPPVSPWAALDADESPDISLSSAAAAFTAVTASTDTDIPAAALSCRRQAMLVSSRNRRRCQALVQLGSAAYRSAVISPQPVLLRARSGELVCVAGRKVGSTRAAGAHIEAGRTTAGGKLARTGGKKRTTLNIMLYTV